MKKPLLLFYFTFCILHFSFSQNPLVKQWDYRFGGTSYDYLYSIQQTFNGGYILGGTSRSGVSGDKTQNVWNFSFDYWIVKVSSNGFKEWDKNFGGTDDDDLRSVKQTSDGGYILGGYSNSGISGDKTQDTIGKNDYWIVKIDSLGNKQWDKDFGGNKTDHLYSIQQTSDAGYILGGTSNSGINGDKTEPLWGLNDYWIVKTDSLGNKQWDKDFGGANYDQFTTIIQTSDKGYLIGGYSASDSSGNKTQDSWGNYDWWIIKTDSLGNKQWDRDFGGTDGDALFSVYQTADSGFILAGTSLSQINGDKSQTTWGGTGDMDFWIIKINSVGVKQWDKDFGGVYPEDEFGSVSQTSDGGYLIAGTSYSPISGDKTENNLGSEQTWVVKTDSLGNKQWDKTLHTNTNDDDEIGFAIQTEDNCFIMGNYTISGIAGDKTQANWGYDDYWIIKFCDTTTTTSITELANSPNTFSISPNPANEILVISNKRTGIREIEIYDLFGTRVLKSSIFNRPSSIDISTLSPGIYFLKAGNEVRKFVKE